MSLKKVWGKTFFSLKKDFFWSIPELQQKYFLVLSNCFWCFCHHCILSVHWNILMKKYFFKKVEFTIPLRPGVNFFVPLMTIVRRRCQDCILGVHGTILSKNNLFGEVKFLFPIFRKNFSVFCWYVFGGIVRRHSTWPWNHFRKKKFKKCFFYPISEFKRKMLASYRTFFHGVVKTVF